MTLDVADVRANLNENIRHAATILGRSADRRKVFEAIYKGKKKIKTADEIAESTGLARNRVLQEGNTLANNRIVKKVQVAGRMAYEKDDTYSQHKGKVLDLVDHPGKRSRYPTKQEPRTEGTSVTYKITMPLSQVPQEVTIDDIQAFDKVRAMPPSAAVPDLKRTPESQVKQFLKLLVGENYKFTDWGGERNDLHTTKLQFRGRRRAAAFAIKGRATSGPLTPKKMGSNGDQIARLFTSEAEIFFVVYHSKVEESVREQLRTYGIARARAGGRVYYCVIDGSDLGRLVAAYPAEFELAGRA